MLFGAQHPLEKVQTAEKVEYFIDIPTQGSPSQNKKKTLINATSKATKQNTLTDRSFPS